MTKGNACSTTGYPVPSVLWFFMQDLHLGCKLCPEDKMFAIYICKISQY